MKRRKEKMGGCTPVALALVFLGLSLPLGAGQGSSQRIKVCAREAFPFIIDGDVEGDSLTLPVSPARYDYKQSAGKRYMGFDIEMMISVSSELGLDFDLQMYASTEEVINAVRNASATGCDVGMGGITAISDHESPPAGGVVSSVAKPCCIDHTYPYLSSGLVLVVPLDLGETGSQRLMRAMFSSSGVNSIAWLMVSLGVAAHLMWFFEHKINPDQFPRKYLDGIDDAVWWAATTVTTVGYGDKVPKSGWGRLVGCCWMFTSIIVLSTFTGIISSELTASAVTGRTPENIQEMSFKTVCIVGTVAKDFLDEHRGEGVIARQGADFLECLEELNMERVDAILHDKASVDFYFKYYADQVQDLETSTIIKPTEYALVTPEGSRGLGSGGGNGVGGGNGGTPGLNRLLSQGIMAYLHGRAASTSASEIRPFEGRSSSAEMWFGRDQAGLLMPSVGDGGDPSNRREEEGQVDWLIIWFLALTFAAYGGVHLYIMGHNKMRARAQQNGMVDVETGSTGAESPAGLSPSASLRDRGGSLDTRSPSPAPGVSVGTGGGGGVLYLGVPGGRASRPASPRSDQDEPSSEDGGVKDSAYSAARPSGGLASVPSPSRASGGTVRRGGTGRGKTMLDRMTSTISKAVASLTDDIATDGGEDNGGAFGSGLYPIPVPLTAGGGSFQWDPAHHHQLRSSSVDSSPTARSAASVRSEGDRLYVAALQAHSQQSSRGLTMFPRDPDTVSVRLDDANSDPGGSKRGTASGHLWRRPREDALTKAIMRMEEKVGTQLAMQLAEIDNLRTSLLGDGREVLRTASMDSPLAQQLRAAAMEGAPASPAATRGVGLRLFPATDEGRAVAPPLSISSADGGPEPPPRADRAVKQNSGKSVFSDAAGASSPRFSHLSSVPRSDVSYMDPSPTMSDEKVQGAQQQEPIRRMSSGPLLSQLGGWGVTSEEDAPPPVASHPVAHD